jgi:hypothetical protein
MTKKFGALADFRQTQVSEPQDDQKESKPHLKVQPALQSWGRGQGRPAGGEAIGLRGHDHVATEAN